MNLSPQFTLDREVDADAEAPVKISAQGVNVFYGEKQALFDVSLDMPDKQVTALIGPSGCGSRPSCAA
jgi:phosphate transport system ATP-binding protein